MPPSSSIPEAVAQAAARLIPAPVTAIEEVRKGGNSRVFKITTAAGLYALIPRTTGATGKAPSGAHSRSSPAQGLGAPRTSSPPTTTRM